MGNIIHYSHTGLDFKRVCGEMDGITRSHSNHFAGDQQPLPFQFLESWILRRRQMTIPIGTFFGSDRTIYGLIMSRIIQDRCGSWRFLTGPKKNGDYINTNEYTWWISTIISITYIYLLPSTQMIDNKNGACHGIYWGDIWRSTGNDGTGNGAESRSPRIWKGHWTRLLS